MDPMTQSEGVNLSLSKETDGSQVNGVKRLVGKQYLHLPPKWVIFQNDVYDLGAYIESENHPGGNAILEAALGEDITDMFESIGHSDFARRLLLSFKVNPENESSGVKDRDNKPQRDAGERISALLDLNSPIIPQIFHLSKHEYAELTSDYVCNNTVHTFFSYPPLEYLSRTVWWVVPLIWVPFSLSLAYYAHFQYNNSLGLSAVCLLLGIFLWTLFEYIIHRFIFHFPEEWLFDSRVVRFLHFLIHGVHHTFPMDPLRLVVPPTLFIVLATPLFGLCRVVLGERIVYRLIAGVILGYVMYDLIHYFTHHCSGAEKFHMLRNLKLYHMKHHFKRPDRGFGVSSPIWDYVFHTHF